MTDAEERIITLLTAILGHMEGMASDVNELHGMACDAIEVEEMASLMLSRVEGSA